MNMRAFRPSDNWKPHSADWLNCILDDSHRNHAASDWLEAEIPPPHRADRYESCGISGGSGKVARADKARSGAVVTAFAADNRKIRS